MRKSQWTTYRITGYTYQAGNDPRATGGVHLHQVRKIRKNWMVRVVDSNGNYQSSGPASHVPDAVGEAAWETARSR